MIFHPGVLALLLGSILTSGLLLYASAQGVRILRNWDLCSGSELQLNLERRTYLISTLAGWAFVFQLLSLFLFVFTAEQMHDLFVGAMCAAGSLWAHRFGYPALILKLVNFMLAGLWLVVNITDNRGYDYPLLRLKYLLLLAATPLIAAEMLLQGGYFLGLEPDVITSCCGSLFSSGAEGVTSGVVALARGPVAVAFYATLVLTFALGLWFRRRGNGAAAYTAASLLTLGVGAAALISYVSPYFYELPTHHCPFDILQREYYFAGYPIYVGLLGGTLCGLGVGVVNRFRRIESLAGVVPPLQQRLALASLIGYAVFAAVAIGGIVFSNLTYQSF